MIEIKELSVEFVGNIKALEQITLTVPEGKCTVVVGESGSGKSVMLSAILGILPLKTKISGSIRLLGEELLSMSDKQIGKVRGNQIAYIPQGSGNSLNPLLKVGFQVAEPLIELKKMPKNKALKKTLGWLRRLNLGNEEMLADAYPHTLSGGMKQRVLIAMGSAAGAPVLLADEPTKGLDSERVEKVIELLQGFKDRTLLCVSHDLHFAETIADYVCVIYSAQQVEYCSRADFYKQPLHPYSEMMLEALPENGFHVSSGFAPTHEKYGSLGCRFYSRCPRRSEQCTVPPPMAEVGGRKVRCWLYVDKSR